ncbi:MAG: hypothetical protein AB1439_10185 [candidate division FCPU426 bacterium]
MRGLGIAGMVVILLGAGSLAALADEATVQALGDTYLVLEDETTVLSLFNLGNPAGAAFLPHHDRLDASLLLSQKTEMSEFTTKPADQAVIVDVYGNTLYPNLDPYGNTLPADTVFSHKDSTWSIHLNQWQTSGYGGALAWLSPEIVLQLDPRAGAEIVSSTDETRERTDYQGGGRLRGAWLASPSFSLGAGVDLARGRISSWEGAAYASWLNALAPTPGIFSSALNADRWSLAAEAGAASRWADLFTPEDLLTVGLTLKAGRQTDDQSLALTETAADSGWFNRLETAAWPRSLMLHGLYAYRNVMDVALETAWQAEEQYLGWDTNLPGLADRSSLLASDVQNLLYSLSFRVRLPMVREDDLRFGVQFDNRGHEHTYPTGRLELLDLATQELSPEITTGSSSIGIGVAVVPAEKSIIAMQYRLGSSKSRQAGELLANSGYNQFGFGAQYEVLRGLTLRFGYTDERVTYESRTPRGPNTSTLALRTWTTNTDSLRFGVGVSDGPMSLNLAVQLTRVAHSPMGWDFPDKPVDLKEVDQDSEQDLSGQLGLTWLF